MAAVFLGIIVLCQWSWDRYLYALPLNDPIGFDPPGIIDRIITIPRPDQYQLELVFSRAGHSLEEMRSLIGNWFPKADGIPVSIEWSISDPVSGSVIAGESGLRSGLSGGGGTEVLRSVGVIKVPPGKYHFQAKVLEAVPQFATISTKLEMFSSFKVANSSEARADWWLTVATVFVFVPLLLGLLVWGVIDVVRGT